MFCKAFSCVLSDTDAHLISVETDIRNGLPGYFLCGAQGELKESKDRVRVAIENAGFSVPPKRITINFSPVGPSKDVGFLDLPIAVSILTAYGLLPDKTKDYLFAGELSLDGSLMGIDRASLRTLFAMRTGFEAIILPEENVKEGGVVEGIKVYGAKNLREVLKILDDREKTKPVVLSEKERDELLSPTEPIKDFSEVKNGYSSIRAILGGILCKKNIMLLGANEEKAAKIMECISGIKMKLSVEDRIVFKEYGRLLDDDENMKVTENGYLLVFDAEKKNSERYTQISRQIPRLNGTISYGKLCPCGYYPDKSRCKCSYGKIETHIKRINPSLLSDTAVFVPIEDDYYEYLLSEMSLSTEQVNNWLNRGAEFAKNNIYRETRPERDGLEFLENYFFNNLFTEFFYYNVLDLARSLADLDEEEKVSCVYLEEAVHYCTFMKKEGKGD